MDKHAEETERADTLGHGKPSKAAGWKWSDQCGQGWWETLEAGIAKFSTVRLPLENNLVAAKARTGAGARTRACSEISPGWVIYNLSHVSAPPGPGG